MSLDKPLESIIEDDLQELVDTQKSENKTLEYKLALPGDTENNKKESLADVSSLANTLGGHLVFGIKEKDGIPIKLAGIALANVDAEKLRLESILRAGLEPKLPRIEIHPVQLASSGNWIFIFRLQRSWLAPHRVIYKEHGHFYARHSGGKYRLDVAELRSAFELSGTTAEGIKAFRAERLNRISTGEETPALLEEEAPKPVLHMIPLSAFHSTARFDITILRDPVNRSLMIPLAQGKNSQPDSIRYNVDGMVSSVRSSSAPPSTAYVQVFHNGIVEAFDSSLLTMLRDQRIISGIWFEPLLLQAASRYSTLQKLLGVNPPIAIMVSFLGIKGYRIAHLIFQYELTQASDVIDRANLLIPEVILDDFAGDITKALKPVFDTVWNAAGQSGSPNYDQNGNFTLKY